MLLENIYSDLKKKNCQQNISSVLNSLDKVCIYGAGGSGKNALYYFQDHGKQVIAFCDSDPKKTGQEIEGVRILSVEDAVKLCVPFVISSMWAKDIAATLQKYNAEKVYDFTAPTHRYTRGKDLHSVWEKHFDNELLLSATEKVNQLLQLAQDEESLKTLTGVLQYRLTQNPLYLDVADYPEYFSPKVLPQEGYIIADCGAWEGDSASNYAQFLHYNCTIHAFEPAKETYRKLEKMATEDAYKNVLIPCDCAVGGFVGELCFDTSTEHTMEYAVKESGTEVIRCTTLDEYFASTQVDLVKMDIESFEREALQGATAVINRDKPDLQICLYHLHDDLYELPLLVNKICQGYQFFFSHHTKFIQETILYARHESRQAQLG